VICVSGRAREDADRSLRQRAHAFVGKTELHHLAGVVTRLLAARPDRGRFD
jgi:hypothetical protein